MILLSLIKQLLLREDMKAVMTISNITQITEADAVAKAFVIIFQDHDRVISLLKHFITLEIQNTG